MTSKTKATILVFLCVFLWAMIPPTSKFVSSNLDNHQFLFYSSFTSFISLLIATIFSKKVTRIKQYKRKDWLNIIILGLLGTYIYYLFLYLGYANAKGLEVLVVQYTWPVLVVVFSLFILKESLDLQKIISILLGFIGVLIVLSKGNITSLHIDNYEVIILVFLGASSFALFSVLSKKIQLEAIGVTSMYFLVATVSSFLSLMYFSEFKFPALNDWYAIILNGLLLNGFSYLFWIKALKLTQASYLAPYVFITPVLSAIYLVVLFDEPIYSAYFIGLGFVVISGVINTIKFKKN